VAFRYDLGQVNEVEMLSRKIAGESGFSWSTHHVTTVIIVEAM
jgi:hypothetical protein